MHNCFSETDPEQPQALVIRKAADPTSRPTRKSGRRFPTDGVEEKDINVVPDVLINRFRKDQILIPRSTATRKPNTSKTGNNKKLKNLISKR